MLKHGLFVQLPFEIELFPGLCGNKITINKSCLLAILIWSTMFSTVSSSSAQSQTILSKQPIADRRVRTNPFYTIPMARPRTLRAQEIRILTRIGLPR